MIFQRVMVPTFSILWSHLVHPLKHMFSVFKQHYMYFHIFFHPHVFPHMFLNTCFQFLSACTKHPLYVLRWQGPSMKTKICILHKKTSSFSQFKKKKKTPLISIVDFSSSFVLVYFYIDIIVSLICFSCWHIL